MSSEEEPGCSDPVPPGPKERQEAQTGPRERQEVQTGPKESQEVQTGPKERQEVQPWPKEHQGVQHGPEERQEVQPGPEERQEVQTGPKERQEVQPGPKERQEVQPGPPKERHEIVCEPCSESGSLLKAEGYCVRCKEFMCLTCIQCHKRMKMSRDHQIQGPDEMPTTKPAQDPLPSQYVPTAECKIHHKETIDHYCKDHKTVCCAVCVILSHTTCANMLRLDDTFTKENDTGEIERFSQRLNDTSEGFRALLQTAEHDHLKVKEREEQLLINISLYKEKAKEKIDKLANALEMSVKEKTLENQKQIDRRISHCNTLLKHSVIISKELRDLQENNRRAEFILMKQSENQLEVLESNIRDMNANTQFINLVFCPDFQLRWALTKTKDLGQLHTETLSDQCSFCENFAQCRHLVCGHKVCRVCMNDEKKGLILCPQCRTFSGSQPDGTLREFSGHFGDNFIKLEFNFPDGEQKFFHPNPGVSYKGNTLVCYLQENFDDGKLLGLLKKAFNQKLISKIEDDKVKANIELNNKIWMNWSNYKSYTRRVTYYLKELGITD